MAKKKDAPPVETNDAAQGTTPIETAPAKKPRKTKTPPAEATTEAQAEVASGTPPAKKGKRAKSDATLQDVFASYVAALEKNDMSDGTIASYRMELALAGDELGLDTRIADLTAEKVLIFFGSDRVQRKRNKKPKSPLSIAKTQRVLRQALQHAENVKMVARAPLPEEVASH